MSSMNKPIERHVAAFNAKDADAEPWGEDSEVISPVGQFRGREQILGFLRVYWEAFPDARLEITRSISEGSLIANEGFMTGTHTGALQTPDGEVPATGRSVRIRWMAMFETHGDELLSEHLYFDQQEFLAQLGLTPGGTTAAA
jgi:steroid delta-isomerase-like uncharacterized protein